MHNCQLYMYRLSVGCIGNIVGRYLHRQEEREKKIHQEVIRVMTILMIDI